MPTQADWLIESNTSGIAKIIMKEEGLALTEALAALFSSRLYDVLADKGTGLYLESPSHLYELYLRENEGE